MNNTALTAGTVVGDTERTVVFCTQVGDHWVAICRKDEAFHPFAVWTVYQTEDGWKAQSGDYAKTLDEALNYYMARGGR